MTATQTHVRRRSRVSIHILPETTGVEEDDEFDEKRVAEGSETEATDETHLLKTRRDSFALPLGLAVGAGGRQEGNAQRTPWRAMSVLILIAAASCMATATLLLLCPPTGTGTVAEVVKGRTICDPYAEFGVLNVSLETPRENVWQPIAAAPECQPSNWVEMIAQAERNRADDTRLDHLRHRTVVVYGDSIDRDHVEDLCAFVGGRHEMIHDQHPLSPPYPPGEDMPPPGYQNPITGERTWLQNGQSHVFDFLLGSPHYYPPARIEDRFDQIVVPLVAGVAKQYGSNPIPDLVSIAPGFWTLLRETVDKQRLLERHVKDGVPYEEAHAQWRAQVWRPPSEWSRGFYEKRIAQIMRHVAVAWPAKVQPSLLWRAPHFVKETDRTPYNCLVALDQIGRSVMARLVAEGKAAAAGGRQWDAWNRSAATQSDGFHAADRAWARRASLDRRLRVDEWGARMLGQTQYFRDDIHPIPLPGSYLYGNMLFHHLTTFLDSRHQ